MISGSRKSLEAFSGAGGGSVAFEALCVGGVAGCALVGKLGVGVWFGVEGSVDESGEADEVDVVSEAFAFGGVGSVAEGCPEGADVVSDLEGRALRHGKPYMVAIFEPSKLISRE